MRHIQKAVWLVLLSTVIVLSAAASTLARQQTENHFYLVSLGTGDPDLITLRAVNTIKASDVIVCREHNRKELAEYLKDKTVLSRDKPFPFEHLVYVGDFMKTGG